MNGTIDSMLPLILVLLPAAIGALILALPEKMKGVWTAALVAGAAASLALSILIAGRPLEFTRAWAGWGMDFSLKLTAQNGTLIVAASALTLLTALYAAFFRDSACGKVFDACMLFALTMSSGALMSNNLVAMLFFWQAMWGPMFGMIHAGGENAWKTSVKAVFTAGLADLTMMLGMGFAGFAAESMTMDVMHVPMNTLGTAGFLLMAVGAVAKLGAVPFHGWLYAASDDAPSPFLALIPGALNLLLGVSFLSKFSGMFEIGSESGALLLVLVVGSGTVLLSGMLSMTAASYKKLAVALVIAQGGALILGASSSAGGLFAYAAIAAAAANCCLFLFADVLEREKAKASPFAAIVFYLASLVAVGVVFSGEIYRIALQDGVLGLILSVVSLIGALFAGIGVLRFLRSTLSGKPVSPSEEPETEMDSALGWIKKSLCDPYPTAMALLRGYSDVSLKINDAISWFYDVAVVWFVGYLSSLVKRAHNGSQSRYVLWVLVGAVIVIAIFALS